VNCREPTDRMACRKQVLSLVKSPEWAAYRRCTMAMIENVTPILRVEDLEASRRYYIQTLGFSLDWDAGRMISVARDRKSIMLCEGEQGQPGTWLWIGVEDADAFFAEFSAKGAHIRSPPRNFSWAYEFEVEDPDGHVLRFGSEPEPADGVFKT
jgi:predicted lactoylglutathione lyase